MNQGAHILIAADSEMVAQDLMRMLRDLGYHVLGWVRNAEEVLGGVPEKKPDLLLLDMDLGKALGGIDLAGIIRSQAGTPIVYLASHLDEHRLDRARQTQPLGYLVKPFSKSALRGTIEIAEYISRIEKQWIESENRYRFLAENAADMISRHDPSGIFLYASPACRAIYGYEPQELVGKPACFFVHPDDMDGRRREWSRTVREGETCVITCRVRRKTGEYIWVETTHKPVLDPLTQMVCQVTAVSRDISERKAAEILLQNAYATCERQVQQRTAELILRNEQLREEVASHQRTALALESQHVQLEMQCEELRRTRLALEKSRDELADLYDFAPVGYVALDARNLVHSANLTACSVLGIERQHLVGKPLVRFVATEQDRQTLSLHCRTVLETCQPQSCEITLVRSDGTRLHAALGSVAVKDGATDFLLCRTVISDITDRKDAEEAQRRWAQVFQHAEWGVTISDPEAQSLVVMNPAFARMHGYEVHELCGRPISEVIAGQSRASLQGHVHMAMAHGHHTFEATDVRKDGTTFPVLVDVTVVRDDDGKVLHHIANVLDISALKRAEQALRASEERFRAFFDGAQDCFFVKDRSLKFTHVNPAAEKLLNRKASDIIGHDAAEVFGKEAARQLKQLDLRVLAGQSIDHVHALPINGVSLTFHDVMVPLRDGEGSIIGICCISRNITDLRTVGSGTVSTRSVYRSKAMCAALDQARFAASTDATILLLGESGSGKDFLARWIHEHSKRASGEFFAINCAALPHELAESELFGHEPGAFTGALRRKRGLLELAEGGTLLLNEVGELSLPLQSKLLTFLDTRSFVRIGGEKRIQVNARLIAATHRDLKACVAEGSFLQPLFFRLNVFTIDVPALRERLDDIPILAEEILAELAREMQLSHTAAIHPDAMACLCSYHWPGNVRELRNALERALMMSGTGVLAHDLPLPQCTDDDWRYSLTFSSGKSLYDVREELTHALCAEALRRFGGNRTEAARFLGISRHSLYRFMKEPPWPAGGLDQ